VPRFRRVVLWAVIWLVTIPQVVAAQESIVIVKSLGAKPYEEAYLGFVEAFAARGRRPSLREYTLKEGNKDEAKILQEIHTRRPALIVTLGSPATSLIQAQVKDLPVVFCMVLNPVASGFIRSMQSSGTNVTGASLDISAKTQFETLKLVLPYVKRVGVLYNARETGEVVESAIKAAAEVGLELIAIPVSTPEQLQGILGTLGPSIDALWSVADSTVFSSDRSVEFLLRQTLQYKMPFMGLSPTFVKAGALLALSVDYRDVGMQCGEQAAQILTGRAPSSLPVTTPRKVTLYINLNVARTIGVEIPPSSMAEAVILK
jgi:putative ABC transport system substrate-binding protein